MSIDSLSSLPASLNTFSMEEKQSENDYSRKVNFTFTDSAIDKVASVLGGYVPLSLPLAPKRPMSRSQQLSLPYVQEDQNRELGHTEVEEEAFVDSVQDKSERDLALDYFERDEKGLLVSTNPDYKGVNRKSQQQRFSVLYVWAYNLIHEEVVPSKEHLIHAAKENGIHDSNYSKHLSDMANRFFVRADGSFKLNPSGKTEASKILSEIQNTESEGFKYWNAPRKRTSSGSRINKDDIQQIDEWTQMSSRLSNFDTRKLDATVKCALFAIYDITKELKIKDAIKPGLAYEYLIKRYKTISAKKGNFTKAMTNTRDNSKYFSRTHEGAYFLTTEAESLVESWLNQDNTENA
jgi:hypothetical protein